MFRKIVIVTLIFSDVVPQLNITFPSNFRLKDLSVALQITFYLLCSVFKVQLLVLQPDLKAQSLKL